MKYRADIDGLRAVAILVVVAFHVGLPGFSGGFIGVDVFFVLSGFLITGILTGELESRGRIFWLTFYARRARRLLPALAIVTLATLVIGMFVLVPDPELRSLGQSVFATMFFASNIFFWLKTGDYFDPDSKLQPLLNTWSLAVEEQFYVVWPLLLGATWVLSRRISPRRSRQALIAVVSASALASFVWSVVEVRSDASAAFFLLPSRLWEMAVGGILALTITNMRISRAGVTSALSIAGLAAIVASVLLLDDSALFPGPAALPVVIGTGCLIVAGQAGGGPVQRLLSAAPLVMVGKLSYSWYLIHWPLLVFARIVWLGDDLLRDSIIGVISLGLAALLYRFVEQPVRLQRLPLFTTMGGTLVAALGTIVVVGAVGLFVGRQSDDFSRLEITSSEQAALRENRTARNACPNLEVGNSTAVDCAFDEDRPSTVALVGDSHALAILPAVRASADELDAGVEMMWTTGCPFVVGYEPPLGLRQLGEACIRENDIRMQYLLDNAEQIDVVLVTGRVTSYVVHDGDDELTAQASELWADAFTDTITQLNDAGLRVAVMHDVPRFELDVPQCLIRRDASACDRRRSEAFEDRRPVLDAERAAVEATASQSWDPFERLCNETTCFTTSGERVLYRDIDHLSEAGAAFVADDVLDLLISADGLR